MNYKLEEVKLSDLSSLEYQIFTTTSQRVTYADISIIKFKGKYGVGSAGSSDAAFMCAVIQAVNAAWHPNALIVDLCELTYVWGDNMAEVLDAAEDLWIPQITVVGDDCKEAIRTLIIDFGGPSAPAEMSYIYENLEDAFSFVERQLSEKHEQI